MKEQYYYQEREEKERKLYSLNFLLAKGIPKTTDSMNKPKIARIFSSKHNDHDYNINKFYKKISTII